MNRLIRPIYQSTSLTKQSSTFNSIQSRSTGALIIKSTSSSPPCVFPSQSRLLSSTSKLKFTNNKSNLLAFSVATYLSNLSTSSHRSYSTSLDSSSLQQPPSQFPQSIMASLKNENVPNFHGNFDLIKRITMDYAPGMAVEKWKSRETGLTVVWADFESPLVNSYITLATEIFEDSGVPHTLEHLIFLGSARYPFKGVLDSLANRAFAQGTNAWTANDHTAYTLTTAGSSGFLRMLPIYLDHVFFPTLTPSGFTTEVYHINEKGEDSGVVFSEMQGRENSSGDLMELKKQRMLYPPSSAYRSETGGLMEKLRILTIGEIQNYHEKYYSPHNSCLVVTGRLNRIELLNSLEKTERDLLEKGKAFGSNGPNGWKRPFVETTTSIPPIIKGSQEIIPGVDLPDPESSRPEGPDTKRRRAFIEFPEKDESIGEIEITFLGPDIKDHLTLEALDVLNTYLSDSPVSTLMKNFVEIKEPTCTDIYLSVQDSIGKSTLNCYFSNVPAEKLDELDFELIKVLKTVVEKDGIDMERMKMILKRERIKLLNQLETKPSDSFADVIITDFLYGDRNGNDLKESLDDMTRYDILEGWTEKQWLEILNRFYVENERLVVIGKPSSQLAEKLKSDNKLLIENRRKELGEKGLKDLEEKLELAKKENDKDIPEEMLKNFEIPNVDSIDFIQVGTGKNSPVEKTSKNANANLNLALDGKQRELDAKVQAHIDADGEKLPFFVQFDHVNSAFISIGLAFGTSNLSPHLRPLLNLYLASLFSLPLTKLDSTRQSLTYEQVVKGLDEDVLTYETGLGVGSGFSELLSLEIKVEKKSYEKGLNWLRDIVWGTRFDVERLRIGAAKLKQSLPEQKRDGRTISWSLSKLLTLDPAKSTNLANSLLSLIESTPVLVEALEKNPEKVIEDFEKIRKLIFTPENMRVAIAGDVLSLEKPRSQWEETFGDLMKQWRSKGFKESEPITWGRDVLSELGKTPQKKGIITPLPTIESSYAVFTSQGLNSYLHPDNAPLVVCIAWLNAMESILWRFIRGAGLAYGASIRSDVESTHIHFSLYRSPDSAKAFLEAKKVIEKMANGEMEIDETTIESAKSSLHFSIAESEGTVGSAAGESFVDETIKAVGKGRGKRLLEETSRVTISDVKRVLKKYILPTFNPSTSIAAIVSTPSKVDEISKSLTEVGYELEKKELDLGTDEDSEMETGSESGSGSESEMKVVKMSR